MQDNPMPSIENAELAARRTIQQANDDKASLIRDAREKADQDFDRALQNAQMEGERMIEAARKESEAAVAAIDAQFEKDKADLIRRAAARETAAIGAVIGILSGKTS